MVSIINCVNKCISTKSFPDGLKVADVILVFKKEDPNNKANYRPISLLPTISKIFERVLFELIEKLAKKISSPKLYSFRKGHSTQHALLNLLKKWQKNFRQVWCYRNSSFTWSPYSPIICLWFRRLRYVYNIWLLFWKISTAKNRITF